MWSFVESPRRTIDDVVMLCLNDRVGDHCDVDCTVRQLYQYHFDIEPNISEWCSVECDLTSHWDCPSAHDLHEPSRDWNLLLEQQITQYQRTEWHNSLHSQIGSQLAWYRNSSIKHQWRACCKQYRSMPSGRHRNPTFLLPRMCQELREKSRLKVQFLIWWDLPATKCSTVQTEVGHTCASIPTTLSVDMVFRRTVGEISHSKEIKDASYTGTVEILWWSIWRHLVQDKTD